MKQLNRLNKLFLLLILPLFCVSCLVDDEDTGGLQGINNSPYIVGFQSSSTLESYFEDLGAVDVDLQVNVLGGNAGIALPSDIQVSYEVDPSSTATEGNEFSLNGNSFTIPAGTTFGVLPVQINTGGLDPDEPTTLVLKLTTTNNSSVVSAINDTYTITFVGCQSNHAGTYTNPDVPSGAGGQATITQTAPNTYTVSALPYLGTGGGVNPIEFGFTNVCGDINITDWAFSGSNLIIGTGAFDETTGAITFRYTVYNGTSIADGIFFDFSSDADASTYTPL
jgi:hypothetical protein